MLKGFKNFLMQGNLVVIAVGLVIALAFSTLVTSFTTTIITPLINALAGSSSKNEGLGWTIHGQRIALGSFLSAIIYFIIFMAVVYFVLVVPYRRYMSKRGISVFATQSPPPPTKTCPECLSTDLPEAATKCLHCASVVA
ncbi:MAG TPA: MscL family protein [Acidimicrobiales bacterium]|jgi:large conductance mechanosensitive channel|nr:MscL family protein [Acidimicrobiales bacterium]